MKKILYALVAAAAFILLFSGCSPFGSRQTSSQICTENDGKTSTGTYTFRYSSKDDSETHSLDLLERGSVRFKMNSMVKDGSVYFSLKDAEDKIIYENTGKRFSFNESFELSEGLYKIYLEYDNAEKGTLKLEVYSDSYFELLSSTEGEKNSKEEKQ